MLTALDITAVLTATQSICVSIFAVCSMLALGLGSDLERFLAPLKAPKVLIMALLGNFVVVPAIGVGAVKLLGLSGESAYGFIILACCAGAPFVLQLGQLAKVNVSALAGMLALLLAVTVV